MDTSAPRAQTPLSSITGSSASNSFGRDSPVFAKICEADDLINQELYEDALLPLAKAIFLSPNESILYIARAEVYLALCDIASAIQNYKKAVKLEWGPEVPPRLDWHCPTILSHPHRWLLTAHHQLLRASCLLALPPEVLP